MKITLATGNINKVKEINLIAKENDCDVEFILPQGDFDPIEDGSTFIENAYCKAKTASINGLTELYLADDSGLCVDFLDGAPGIKSARYASSPEKRIEKLLFNMQNATNRSARFVCAMVICNKKGEILFKTQKECLGSILKEKRGSGGFGYDPVFLLKDGKLSMAELEKEQKAKISHRAKALKDVINWLKNNIKKDIK